MSESKAKEGASAPFSEVQHAIEKAREGDFGPHFILDAKAGHMAPLAAHIRAFGLPPHSDLALFVADFLEGKIKATRHENLVWRDHAMLVLVQRYSQRLDWLKVNDWQQHPNMTEDDRKMRNMDDVYNRVAYDLHMSYDAVKKAIDRDKKKRRSA